MNNKWKRLRLLSLNILVFITICLFNLNDIFSLGKLEIHYINVGSADAIYIECDGQNMLIDGGYLTEADRLNDTNLYNELDNQMHGINQPLNESNENFLNDFRKLLSDNNQSKVSEYLQSKNIKHINYIVSSHPHFDHIGGLLQVLNTCTYDNLYYNGKEYNTKYYRYFLKLAEDNVKNGKVSAVLQIPQMNQSWKLGNATITILSNQSKDYSTISGNGDYTNNESIVLRLDYGKRSFLFTADAQVAAQSYLIKENTHQISNIDVLKVPHHGHTNNDFGVSSHSGNYEFFKVVNPLVSVVQCGYRNTSSTIPTTKVRKDLEMSDIYTTKDMGHIIVESDGEDIRVIANGVDKKYHYTKNGDANEDGNITPADYVKIKNHIMGNSKLSIIGLRQGDLNGDGKITPADYVKVKNQIMS